MVAIDTTALTKRFKDVTAVDELDLRIEEGEIFGFLGPNGAGKSTTINMLLDFHRPTSGSATVLGYDAQDETDAIRRRVGVLPEGMELYGRLTAREHLKLCVQMKDAADDPDAVLDRVGLNDAVNRPVSGFSKGMAQRLALGIALVGSPDLLILDEPTSGLDPNGIQEFRDLLRAEAESGTTVFFSSHVLSEVEAVCDRVGIMNEGSLVALDTIDNLREHAGSGGVVDLTLESVPDDLSLGQLAGVTDVTIDGTQLHVSCATPQAKINVIQHVDRVSTVTGIVVEETSLEDLFNEYTNGGREGSGETERAAEVIA
ncbi:ABC transporter ATP-binding protein [Halocatena pleomorpha]|uniref:ABC transporter ATP-binding protein n=1 Tax=Halocatena pleomorpha TaxID=1785090 RepID=A0A3P3RLX4_9EURY|nr:ABC transporter ATP-binding protein [Halocatena pleomorpha]RRJ33850.1 ABC transporter ATP-binding protein [Halocatena pleomorpha]